MAGGKGLGTGGAELTSSSEGNAASGYFFFEGIADPENSMILTKERCCCLEKIGSMC